VTDFSKVMKGMKILPVTILKSLIKTTRWH